MSYNDIVYCSVFYYIIILYDVLCNKTILHCIIFGHVILFYMLFYHTLFLHIILNDKII